WYCAVLRATTNSRKPFLTQSCGAAQPAFSAGAARLRTAFRRFRGGLDLGIDSSPGAAVELDVRVPVLSENAAARWFPQLRFLYFCRDAAVVALPGDPATVSFQPAGTVAP